MFTALYHWYYNSYTEEQRAELENLGVLDRSPNMSEFIGRSRLPENIELNESLKLSDRTVYDLKKYIERKADESFDYKYDSKEQVLARTAMLDLRFASQRGTILAILGTYASYKFLQRKTNLVDSKSGARILRIGAFFMGAGVYWITTQGAYNQYAGISARVNKRVGDDFSKMLDLKATKDDN